MIDLSFWTLAIQELERVRTAKAELEKTVARETPPISDQDQTSKPAGHFSLGKWCYIVSVKFLYRSETASLTVFSSFLFLYALQKIYLLGSFQVLAV